MSQWGTRGSSTGTYTTPIKITNKQAIVSSEKNMTCFERREQKIAIPININIGIPM
jgi:hypothetical protein